MKHTWSLRLQEDAFLGDDLHHFLQCWKKGNTALIGGGCRNTTLDSEWECCYVLP